MILGFTGTQFGMARRQLLAVVDYLTKAYSVDSVRHGDCIGADAEFHMLARLGKKDIFKHPPINSYKRAFCEGGIEYAPKEYIARNHDIVDMSDFLLATPREYQEQVRSGTWATIRYARKRNKPVKIIYPDGSISSE